MKILLLHCFGTDGDFGAAWIHRWISRLRRPGLDVDAEYAGLQVRGRRLPWPELDRSWSRGELQLLHLYERVARLAESVDVLINFGGVNLHPEFLRQLNTTNVLGFFDDPESSENFSRPVATAHDLCLVGNIAELDTYRTWGVDHVAWWPLGFREEDYDPSLTEEDILSAERDVDLVLLCERVSRWRRQRVDDFSLAFPQGIYRGRGWPGGFLAERERVPLLQRTKVGINIHNSTGPINFRTFYLPANGVLQVCDNKTHFARVFNIGAEAVGFQTIPEAIDLCRYYLAHDEERRFIANAGWKRALRDYNEVAAFDHVVRAITTFWDAHPRAKQDGAAVYLVQYRHATRFNRSAAHISLPVRFIFTAARRAFRKLIALLLKHLFDLRYGLLLGRAKRNKRTNGARRMASAK